MERYLTGLVREVGALLDSVGACLLPLAPHVLRAATRLNDHPGPRIANVGFRLA